MSSYCGMDASLQLGFALCCHSNATRASFANPPNSAQLGGSPYHSSKLHPGPRNTVGMRPRTDTQTDTQTHVTTIHFALTTHAKCNLSHVPCPSHPRLTHSRCISNCMHVIQKSFFVYDRLTAYLHFLGLFLNGDS